MGINDREIIDELPEFPTRVGFLSYVVKDVNKSIKFFKSLMSINNWMVFDFPGDVDKLTAGTPNKQKIAIGTSAAVTVELRQPVSGKSIWAKFLKANGEGLHHCGYLVADVDKKVQSLLHAGGIIREAGISEGRKWYCVEFDTGIMVEFEEAPEGCNTLIF